MLPRVVSAAAGPGDTVMLSGRPYICLLRLPVIGLLMFVALFWGGCRLLPVVAAHAPRQSALSDPAAPPAQHRCRSRRAANHADRQRRARLVSRPRCLRPPAGAPRRVPLDPAVVTVPAEQLELLFEAPLAPVSAPETAPPRRPTRPESAESGPAAARSPRKSSVGRPQAAPRAVPGIPKHPRRPPGAVTAQ